MESNRDAVIRQIISEVVKGPVEIGRDESLFESDILDSFGLTDVVNALEERFGIKIPDSDLGQRYFESIASIDRYLERHKKA